MLTTAACVLRVMDSVVLQARFIMFFRSLYYIFSRDQAAGCVRFLRTVPRNRFPPFMFMPTLTLRLCRDRIYL